MNGMGCDAAQNIGEPGVRIDGVELAGDDQAVHGGGALAAAVTSAEELGLAAERYPPERPLCGVVGEADPAVVQEAREGDPALEHVVAGLVDVVATREGCELGLQVGVERLDERLASILANSPAGVGAVAVDPSLDGEQGVDLTDDFDGDGRQQRWLAGGRAPGRLVHLGEHKNGRRA
jgi:hypothetical protein